MTEKKKAREGRRSARKDKAGRPHDSKEEAGFPIAGIGASAGGLEALEQLFRAMPADTGHGFVVVAHLDPTHASLLPELLQKSTKMPVCQAKDGIRVEPNSIYVIPPNKELGILNVEMADR